jgi:dTMP kinase
MFIVFEGIDGSGKSSIIKEVFKLLIENNCKCILTKEPFGSPLKIEFFDILKKLNEFTKKNYFTDYLLFAAERSLHIEQVIIPALKQNKIVLSDRFFGSSVAYQGFGGNLEVDFIKYIFEKTNFGIYPDITFYCDISIETSLKRIYEKKQDFLDKSFIKNTIKIKEGYDFLYKQNNKDKNVFIINTERNINETMNEVFTIINRFVNIKR